MTHWLLLAASVAAPSVNATELPALADLVTVMQPYLDCRTPFDRQMIEIETGLRGWTYGPRPDAALDPGAAAADEELRFIDQAARSECNEYTLQNTLLDMLPRNRGNRAYTAIDLIHSAEALRRVQLTYEENLYVWETNRTVTTTPGSAGEDQ